MDGRHLESSRRLLDHQRRLHELLRNGDGETARGDAHGEIAGLTRQSGKRTIWSDVVREDPASLAGPSDGEALAQEAVGRGGELSFVSGLGHSVAPVGNVRLLDSASRKDEQLRQPLERVSRAGPSRVARNPAGRPASARGRAAISALAAPAPDSRSNQTSPRYAQTSATMKRCRMIS